MNTYSELKIGSKTFTTGFRTFNEAQLYADTNNGEVVKLYKRDGRQWENKGFESRAFTIFDKKELLSDNESLLSKEEIDEYFSIDGIEEDDQDEILDRRNKAHSLINNEDEYVLISYGIPVESYIVDECNIQEDVHMWQIAVEKLTNINVLKSDYKIFEFNAGYYGICKKGSMGGQLVFGGDSANEDDYNEEYMNEIFDNWDGELVLEDDEYIILN